MKALIIIAALVVTGCATMDNFAYNPGAPRAVYQLPIDNEPIYRIVKREKTCYTTPNGYGWSTTCR